MLFLEIHFNVNTNLLAIVFIDLDIYRLLTFQVPNLVSSFCCLLHSYGSVGV